MAHQTEIMVNGVLTVVTEFDHSAQEIDDALFEMSEHIADGGIHVTAEEKQNWDAKAPRENLLDNWYFADPVDQRGGYVVPPGVDYSYTDWSAVVGTTDTYYPVKRWEQHQNLDAIIEIGGVEYVVDHAAPVRGYTGAVHTVDRMNTYISGTVLITDNGIHLINTADWGTQIEISRVPINVPVTLSVLTDKGIGTVTHTFSGATNEQIYTDVGNGVTINALYNWTASGTFLFCLQAGDSIVRGMKLELGSHQTLAHQEDGKWVLNEIPNYADTLARCQRYLRTGGGHIGENSIGGRLRFFNLFPSARSAFDFVNITFDSPMRCKPVGTVYYRVNDGVLQEADLFADMCGTNKIVPNIPSVPAGACLDIVDYIADASL